MPFLRRGGARTHELAFVDEGITNLPALLAGLRNNVEAHVLIPCAEGENLARRGGSAQIAQIARMVRGREDVAAIHIIAHGRPGAVCFTDSTFDLEAIGAARGDLADIGRALGESGVLNLWTCETAKGSEGRAFVSVLEEAVGAPVLASRVLIGSAAKGGIWDLDAQSNGTTEFFTAARAQAPLTASAIQTYEGVMATSVTGGTTLSKATNGTLTEYSGDTLAG